MTETTEAEKPKLKHVYLETDRAVNDFSFEGRLSLPALRQKTTPKTKLLRVRFLVGHREKRDDLPHKNKATIAWMVAYGDLAERVLRMKQGTHILVRGGFDTFWMGAKTGTALVATSIDVVKPRRGKASAPALADVEDIL